MKFTSTHLLHAIGLGAITLGLQACGSSAPTPQLIDARRAYDQAQMSPASKLTQDHLMTAHQALQAAEKAHRDDPGSTREAHLAYLAERKAQQALAYGKIAQAKQSENHAKGAYVSTLENGMVQSKSQLAHEKTARQTAESARQTAEQERAAADARAEAAFASLTEIAKVKKDDRGTVLTISGAVLFENGKSVLSSSARQSLDKVADALQQQSAGSANKMRIEGYTDSRGSDALNDQLSAARAQAVRDYLVQRGIDSGELEAVGRGKANPIASNDTAEGRATNRRVEIVIPPLPRQASNAGSAAGGGVATTNR